MPHLIIEYSSNLEEKLDFKALVTHMHQAAATSGVFPLKGIRTRCARRDTYRIADGHSDNGFVHVLAKIGHGRSEETRTQASDHLFAALTDFLDSYYQTHPLAISLEIQQIDPLTSRKRNNLPGWVEQRLGNHNE